MAVDPTNCRIEQVIVLGVYAYPHIYPLTFLVLTFIRGYILMQ